MMTNDEILRTRAGITFDQAVSNILTVWQACTAQDVENGAQWYGEAGAVVADMSAVTGHSRVRCAVVIAHLSPRTTWARNISAAWAVLTAGIKGEDQWIAGRAAGAMGGNLTRAIDALTAFDNDDALATLKGPKTRAFALNILGDRDAVTVDVWAVRIALSPDWRRGMVDDAEKSLSRAGVYAAIAEAYRVAAWSAGVDPTTMQASTWVRARNGRAA